MTLQVNGNYLKDYAKQYAGLVSDRFFNQRQFITGQEIIQLTSCIQVNFFIIKRLFELWQEELAKLKSSPYFDYRDIAVHDALTQFMNVLSRRIKVERSHFEPMVQTAVEQAVVLATDPVRFYQSEINKAPQGKTNEFLKENKKYYKWHDRLITFLIDKAGFGNDSEAYHRAISANYQAIRDSLESVNLLLATLGEVKAFNIDFYLVEAPRPTDSDTEPNQISIPQVSSPEYVRETDELRREPAVPVQSTLFVDHDLTEPKDSVPNSGATNGFLNPSKLKARFDSERYPGMQGILGDMSESLALNQRFMFSKELFEGNADLLRHALKSIEEAGSFDAAVDLVNSRFAREMRWQVDSEPVNEFMLLVYRKYCI
jgi:hypothetical protein